MARETLAGLKAELASRDAALSGQYQKRNELEAEIVLLRKQIDNLVEESCKRINDSERRAARDQQLISDLYADKERYKQLVQSHHDLSDDFDESIDDLMRFERISDNLMDYIDLLKEERANG